MLHLGGLILSGAVWVGTAQVYVMNWEGGGEHPYRTDFALRYREGAPVALRDPRGKVIGRRIPLAPERIELTVWHEVRGLLNCVGTGRETVTDAAAAAIVVPLRGETLREAVGADVPAAGAYQLVLPRAYAAYACGQSQRNRGDRRAGVGLGLFPADVEFDDRDARFVDPDGARMRGAYSYSRARSADGSVQHLVTKQIHVEWDLRKQIQPEP